jgi:UPF0755 protein
VVAIVTIVVIVWLWYVYNLRPLAGSSLAQYFTVSRGTPPHQISINLQKAHLVRSAKAFETYITLHRYRERLQAGTYSLSPSMSSQTIASKLANGKVATNLLTILPGKRLDQIKQAFLASGYSQSEVDSAFDPANYAGHPVLASLPKDASLEGYLYPDSFQKQADTPATAIVRESLDEMQKHLTPDIIKGFTAHGLNTHQGITLASIIIKETDNPPDAPIVSQVLLTRLTSGSKLQSDVTAFYSADVRGVPRSINIDSAYNTYLVDGLPPGPISNVNAQALRAAAFPANTDYLYYVAGDDGKIHFSKTAEEHQAAVEKYCKKGCAQ